MALVRTFRFALRALVLLGLAGCSDPVEPFPPVCGVVPLPSPVPVTQNSGLMKVGQRFTLFVSPASLSSCDSDGSRPTSVTAEIDGPGGERLEGQIQLGVDSSPATLQFTPVRPGPHHILVAFSQVGGLHQFDFQAVMDNSTTAPSFTLNRACLSLERTQKGLWVCGTEVLSDNGTLVGSFTDSRVAVAGDVIWVVGPDLIRRYVDRGGALALEGFMNHTLGEATSLLPSADELLVVHLNGSMALYTFSGGTAVTSTGATSWNRSYAMMGASGPFGLLLRDGDQLGLVTHTNVNFQTVAQVCPYRLVSGQIQRVTGSCTVLTGDVVGFEPRVLWTRLPPTLTGGRVDQGALLRWEWSGGRLVEAGSVSLGINARLVFPTMLSPSNAPIIIAERSGSFTSEHAAVALWSAERRTILFEHLDSEVVSTFASPTFFWGILPQTSGDRVTKVRLRPQAPVP
jgi:hypothetical protein